MKIALLGKTTTTKIFKQYYPQLECMSFGGSI